jgi:hypothetical protein
MFDLEKAFARWRQDLAAAGIGGKEMLDELESHLREDVQEQVEKGASAAEAFARAVQRMGQPAALSREFQRAKGVRKPPAWFLKIFVAAALYVGIIFATSLMLRMGMISVALLIGQFVILAYLAAWAWHAWTPHGRARPNRGPTMSPRTHHALWLAMEEAKRFHHEFIGTEHLLLGLLRVEEESLRKPLQGAGIRLEAIRAEVERLVGVGAAGENPREFTYTPRCHAAMALAGEEARAGKQKEIRPEHMLLGLLLEGGGVAAVVLKKLGVEAETMRREIREHLDPPAEK